MYPLSYELISPGATGASGATPGNAQAALVSASIATAQVTFDGSAATGSTGHVLSINGAPFQVPLKAGTNIQVRGVSGLTGSAGAQVHVTYLGC